MASTAASASLAGVSTVGAGTTVDFTRAKSKVSAAISVSATLSAGVVTIEASQDNSNWVTLKTRSLEGSGNVALSFEGVAFRYWRARIVIAAVGGTIRATFMEADPDAGIL